MMENRASSSRRSHELQDSGEDNSIISVKKRTVWPLELSARAVLSELAKAGRGPKVVSLAPCLELHFP